MNNLKIFLKNNLSIIVTIILFVIIYGGSVYFLNKKLTETQKQIQNLENNAKILDDEIIRTLSSKVDDISSLEDEIKLYSLNLDAISKDMEDLSAKLNTFSVVQVKTPGGIYSGLPSTRSSKPDSIIPTPSCTNNICEDPFGHLTNKQYFTLFEPFNKNTTVPFGEVSFEAWKKNPWSLKVLPREYQVVTLLGERGHDLPPVVYNQFKIKVNNQEFDVPVSHTKTVVMESPKGFRVKPNLFLGVGSGVSVNNQPNAEVYPFIEASVFEYGKENYNPSWAFLGISAGFNTVEQSFAVGVSPFQYNIADHLPLINNLFIGPQVSFSTEETISILGTLKVKL